MSGKAEKRLRRSSGMSIAARRDRAMFEVVVSKEIDRIHRERETERKNRRVLLALVGLSAVIATAAAVALVVL